MFIAVKPRLTQSPSHIATRMMTSAFSRPYASTSSPAGACAAGSCICSSTTFAAVPWCVGRDRRPPPRPCAPRACCVRSGTCRAGRRSGRPRRCRPSRRRRRSSRRRARDGSNSGANARPVAGPPVRVTDPASTPISGCWPISIAVTAPTTFWAMATTVENRKNTSTSGPPTRSSDRLAPKPMVVKKAICSGAASVDVELDERQAAALRDQDGNRHEQAADDGGRDVVARQRRDEALDTVADEQNDARKRKRLHQVENEQAVSQVKTGARGLARASAAQPAPTEPTRDPNPGRLRSANPPPEVETLADHLLGFGCQLATRRGPPGGRTPHR